MNRRYDRVPRAAAAAACAVLLLLSPTPGDAAGARTITGNAPKAVSRLRPVEHYNGTNRLQLAIGLPLRDSEGLSAFLQDVYNPASPNFHHFLTPAQFTARFSPSVADYEAVKEFALSNHLLLKGTHPNRTLLDVEGSVADIEKALHVTMQLYKHPTEDRNFIAPDTDPSVNCAVPILHVSGLDNYFLPHANNKSRPLGKPAPGQPMLGSGPGGTYSGGDFRAAYLPGVTLDGTGQKVGLFELDAYFASDPVEYEQQAGLPKVPLKNVSIGGFNGPPGPNNTEVSLDIDVAVAMAPGLSEILVYEATNSGFTSVIDDMLNRMATDDAANQLSASWSYGIDPLTDQIYKQMAVQGQSFFNASGDSGAYPPGDVTFTPCADTNITIVGGTTLFTTGPGGHLAVGSRLELV